MPQCLKILNLTKFYFPYKGGMETVVKQITDFNIQKGIVSDVLCANEKFESSSEIINGAFINRAPRIMKLKGTSICPTMPFLLRQLSHQYDLIHTHFPDPMTALSLYLTKPSTPFIIHWHSDIVKQRKFIPLFSPVQNWCLEEAKKILVTSQIYAEHSEYLKPYIQKVRVVPIGIAADTKPRLKNFGNTKKILSVGRLTEYKGFDILIEAMDILPSDFTLTIVGSGELYARLTNLINAKELSSRICIKQNVSTNELEDLYDSHDIFCLSSNQKSEAFGVVLIEAMSHSLPIVACDIPGSGVPWVNAHGISGINIPINNPKKLAEAIEFVFKDANYEKFSHQSFDRYEKNFRVITMMEKIWKIYSEIVPKI